MSPAHDPGPDPRPASAVSSGVGWAGLAGLLAWTLLARFVEGPDGERMTGPYAALAALFACGAPMVLWSLLVDRVHRSPTTGIDWDGAPRPLRDIVDIALVKLAGLWATWGLIAIVYALGRWYWTGNYLFAMELFRLVAIPLALLSIPYVLWLDRRLVEPRDNAWHFGQALIGGEGVDRERVYEHLRQWAVKGFFLAFMLGIVPPNWTDVIERPWERISGGPVEAAAFLIAVMFLIDVTFATVGYMLTVKPLDAHIRSANPYAAGWAAALICYPPFILMGPGGVLDYQGDHDAWTKWLAGSSALLWLWGAALVVLTGVYAWATVAFGLRFSNLTHRGILTHGPYRWTKHPAYLSKNLFWWLVFLPFLPNGSLIEAARNTALLGVVSAVYYWRARTEEAHLGADPDYRAYAAWMARNGPLTRLLSGRSPGRQPIARPAE